MRRPTTVRTAAALAALFLATLLLLPTAAAVGAADALERRTVEIDCDAGESLAAALATGAPETTYRVSGTCEERIHITADGVTIDGGGTAIIDAETDADGPVVHVDGARRLAISGITVQNGQHGILVERLATLTLDGVVARDNRSHGVEVIQSHIVVTDLTASGNGRVGLIVNRNAELRLVDSILEENGISGLVIFSSAVGRLEGTNVIRGNGDQGFTVGLGGMIFSIGAELIVEGSGAEGIAFLQGGTAQFLGGSITVQGNAGDGIALGIGSTLVLGQDDFPVQGEVRSEGNEGHGVSVTGASHLVAEAIMPLTSVGNGGAGLHVDDGTVRLAGTTLEGNDGPGLELAFGARATTADTTADEVVCDDSVLLRGALGCPNAP
jgi:hypothetical protein